MKYSLNKKIKQKFQKNTDFVTQTITLSQSKEVNVFFIDNMIDKALVSKEVIAKLQEKVLSGEISVDTILKTVTVAGAKKEEGYEKCEEALLSGSVVIVADWFEGSHFITCPCQGFGQRTVAEPPTSAVQKGPREGFTEDLTTNLGLIRKRLRTADLKAEEVKLGRYTDTKVVVVYIDSVADPKVVKEVKKRIEKINIDGIVDSYYVESLITPKNSVLFKQVGNTEKPDIAVAKILEGRVAIMVDGSPMALTVPYVFIEDLQSGDDYYDHPSHATFIRLIRMFGLIVAITLPGVYVALQSFHYGILPIDFLLTLQNSIEGLSYPPLIEILVVLFLFEILNEASVRMPKYSGMALSIVGALVLGDTAVQAGIISPPAVIMVAISGITLFTVPGQVSTASILRLVFTIIGGVAGFYGILVGFLFLTSYLMTLDSFGSAYFAPYAPNIEVDKKDGVFKQKLSAFATRPKSIPNKNKVRQTNEQSSV